MSALCFPLKVLDAHAAVLGKTGAGKSSAMRHVVEYLLSHNKRVVIIDPKGDWWGLKSDATGKGPGFPIVTFGSFKSDEDVADVPINEESGKDVAELIVGGNRPAIIGFRGWYTAHMLKFWIDFAKGLFHGNQGELYLFVDEIQNFAPKGSTRTIEGQGGLALHWANRMLAEGRGLGINIWIGSQRPQKVHNDTLDGCETLVAMRSVHPAARGAINAWMQGAADKKKSAVVLDALGAMKRGEAVIWSPEIEFGPQKVDFPLFTTFDSFAPPQLQKKVHRKDWASVDLDVVKEKLARIVKEKEQNDPAKLRLRIRELESRRDGITSEQEDDLRDEITRLTRLASDRLGEIRKLAGSHNHRGVQIRRIAKELNLLADTDAELSDIPIPQREPEPPRPAPPIFPKSPLVRKLPASNGEFAPTRKQQQILDALAWYESIGNPSPRAIQVGAVALIDASGGHFSNTVGPLSSNGLVNRSGGTLSLTDAGRALANLPERTRSLAEYHDVLRARVRKMKSAGGKTIDILNVIISRNGGEVTTEEIGAEARIDHSGGHFSNMIGPLSTAGLITRSQGIVRPTDVLFPPGIR